MISIATSNRVQTQKAKVARLESQIRNAQARLSEARKALAREELLQLKEQIETIGLPFDELMDLLRQLAKGDNDEHKQ